MAHGGLRLREAAKLGFAMAYGPADGAPGGTAIDYRGVDRLAKLVDRVMATA